MNSNTAPTLERFTGEDLKRALDDGQLRVMYQPQYDLAKQRIAGAEALLRWQHPELGWIRPSEFIALAERTRLINDMGRFVLRRACSDLRGWHDAGMMHWRVAVNVSPVQLLSRELYRYVCEALTNDRLPADALTLEITETVGMQTMDASRRVLFALTMLGVRISLDDFGTGFSNLGRLRYMPVHEIKVARELVQELDTNRIERQLLATIVSMASALKLSVVVEGVERDSQLAYARALGCDLSQGYFHGQAVSADQFLQRHGSSRKMTGGHAPTLLEVLHG